MSSESLRYIMLAVCISAIVNINMHISRPDITIQSKLKIFVNIKIRYCYYKKLEL